ncbi:hypothetical protein FCH28_06040 [Streptomyces piniterrae]|uniref:Uncharacterized protein n=1 Tax=Streptomyces piniterrae TaxID=2571125 RepID=A0A4U0NR18_9ACTN|nr:hypothetical protein [Streptomyces piniterrae]TJZ57031.1 hypothetical protein FCH28_06040 [Streptomyces piniterrae]
MAKLAKAWGGEAALWLARRQEAEESLAEFEQALQAGDAPLTDEFILENRLNSGPDYRLNLQLARHSRYRQIDIRELMHQEEAAKREFKAQLKRLAEGFPDASPVALALGTQLTSAEFALALTTETVNILELRECVKVIEALEHSPFRPPEIDGMATHLQVQICYAWAEVVKDLMVAFNRAYEMSGEAFH